jgi:hypothetical protein
MVGVGVAEEAGLVNARHERAEVPEGAGIDLGGLRVEVAREIAAHPHPLGADVVSPEADECRAGRDR